MSFSFPVKIWRINVSLPAESSYDNGHWVHIEKEIPQHRMRQNSMKRKGTYFHDKGIRFKKKKDRTKNPGLINGLES